MKAIDVERCRSKITSSSSKQFNLTISDIFRSVQKPAKFDDNAR